jgi:hypothetical protein
MEVAHAQDAILEGAGTGATSDNPTEFPPAKSTGTHAHMTQRIVHAAPALSGRRLASSQRCRSSLEHALAYSRLPPPRTRRERHVSPLKLTAHTAAALVSSSSRAGCPLRHTRPSLRAASSDDFIQSAAPLPSSGDELTVLGIATLVFLDRCASAGVRVLAHRLACSFTTKYTLNGVHTRSPTNSLTPAWSPPPCYACFHTGLPRLASLCLPSACLLSHSSWVYPSSARSRTSTRLAALLHEAGVLNLRCSCAAR